MLLWLAGRTHPVLVHLPQVCVAVKYARGLVFSFDHSEDSRSDDIMFYQYLLVKFTGKLSIKEATWPSG